ncbi:hypothetical protein HZ326_30204 [Fusarium oxysporum f. sp. albedinis]|nr:hypothetical protein HZ326_30204 [Fusarium oxysporum f. sp. albedinis]
MVNGTSLSMTKPTLSSWMAFIFALGMALCSRRRLFGELYAGLSAAGYLVNEIERDKHRLSKMVRCGRRGLHRKELRCASHITSIAAPDTEEGGVGQGVNVVGGKPAGDGESGEFGILLVKWNTNHV